MIKQCKKCGCQEISSDNVCLQCGTRNKSLLCRSIIFLLTFFSLIVGYGIISPYITVYKIKEGIKNQDSEKLSKNIDFQLLRQNLKEQVSAYMVKKAMIELKNNPFGPLAIVLVPKLVDGIVDTFVTPAGLVNLMEGKKPGENFDQREREPFRNATYSFDSLSKFSIWIPNDHTEEVRFVLTRGILNWKLSNIVIPTHNGSLSRGSDSGVANLLSNIIIPTKNSSVTSGTYSSIADMRVEEAEKQAAQQRAAELPAPTEAQQKVAKLRERQLEQETAEAKTATEAQQNVVKLREQQAQQEAAEQRGASLRTEETEKQAAQQRVAALRARAGSGGSAERSGSGAGSGLGSSTTGIRLRIYLAELKAKIYDAWNIPSRSKGLEAAFFLSINRAGQVEQARLVQGSGNATFDESVQRAIKQAQPLSALPEDFTSLTLDVRLTFRDSGR